MKRELSATEISNIKITAEQMNEKQRRQYYYRKAQELGYGGISYVARVFQVSKTTLVKAGKELAQGDVWKKGERSRKAGGGRKKVREKIKGLKEADLKIVDPKTYGIPTQTMKWTTKSLRKIKEVLHEDYGINVCHSVVQDILAQEGYSRQKNKKAEQVGKADPDSSSLLTAKRQNFWQPAIQCYQWTQRKKKTSGIFLIKGQNIEKRGNPVGHWIMTFQSVALGK